jgi:hypothetical protein
MAEPTVCTVPSPTVSTRVQVLGDDESRGVEGFDVGFGRAVADVLGAAGGSLVVADGSRVVAVAQLVSRLTRTMAVALLVVMARILALGPLRTHYGRSPR